MLEVFPIKTAGGRNLLTSPTGGSKYTPKASLPRNCKIFFLLLENVVIDV